MDITTFRELKEELKDSSVSEVLEGCGWSLRTLYRVRQARSFKQYRELCKH